MENFQVGNAVQIIGGQRGRITETVDFGGFLGYEIELDSGNKVTEAAYRLNLDVNRETPECPINQTQTQSVLETDGIISDGEIYDFITAQENANTARKTLSDVNILRNFMTKKNMTLAINRYAPNLLAKILAKFFMEIQKQDGTDYEPASLRGMLSSFERYLKRHGYECSLIESVEFAQMREVMKARQVMLKKDGKGNKPKKSESFTDEDLETLYNKGQLGDHHPEALLRTVWLLNSINFGMRGVTEHRDMCWGDINLHRSSEGREYLEYNERTTKTRSGKNPRETRAVKPKAWALPQESSARCPVKVYKRYKSLRPANYCTPDAPFYIATNTRFNNAEINSKWFKCQPVGVNKLGKFMKVMAKNAGLTESKEEDGPTNKKRLTNHSARKYVVQKLKDSNVSDTEIMQITGHKNIQSINSYSNISERRHQQIGTFLSGGTDTSSSSTSTATCTSVNENGSNGNVSCSQTTLCQIQSQSNTNSNTSNSNNSNSNTMCSASSDAKSVFGGVIYGGTFNITVHHHAPKSRRLNVIYSDSDSQSQ